ncbi:MAG: ubiquinone/menaquinone biosynthesis methyltransferase [Thermoplasmatota archaeon]
MRESTAEGPAGQVRNPTRATQADSDNATMFNAIAPRYDLVNRVMSLQLDERWRRATARALRPNPGGTYVDLGAGTGDLSRAILRCEPRVRVVALEPARAMLTIGGTKVPGADWMQGSGLAIPFRADGVDGIASAFVLRNLRDPAAYFAEAYRVLRPGCVLANLEIGQIRGAVVGPLYRAYFFHALPRIGAALSGNGAAYRYLADSVRHVAPPEAFASAMGAAGFSKVAVRRFSGGAVALVTGEKPGRV